jgi:hypothetical protein
MKKMNKKFVGIIICTLMIIVTIFPVEGTITTTRQNKTNNLIVNDLMQPSGKQMIPISHDTSQLLNPDISIGNRAPPEYQFIETPTTIMTSFYDYMPGGYTTYPIQLQTDHGTGQYLTFHAKPASSGNRRQYYAYVNETFAIQSGLIGTDNINEGYGSITIHPKTGDPIVSWHDGAAYTTRLTYDDFDAAETAGNWKIPVIIPKTESMQYIWPVMYSGPSPQGEGFVRIYQVSNNALQISGALPCEDVRIMYADVPNVNGANLSGILSLANWTTVTVFTSWRDKACRPFQSFAIDYNHPGKVAFIGYAAWLNGDLGDMPVEQGAFVWESFDYGAIWNPTNIHSDGPSDYLYQVNNPGFEGAPSKLDVTIVGYHNTALYDSEGSLHWTFMQSYGFTDTEGAKYYPMLLPQAEMIWDGRSFTFHEVPELPGVDSYSGHSVPWDATFVYPTVTWSTYPAGTASIFHENKQQQAINTQKNWMAQLWADGTYASLGALPEYPDFAEYVQHPILYLTVSSDNGRTWSEPIQLTDIHNELFDFSEQITVYPYLCDQITDLGEDWGQINLMYYDDNTFGSSVQGSGANTGGQITYCSVKIKFPEPGALMVDAHGPYSANVGEPISFVGSATGGVPPYTWKWDFGNGITSNEKNPIYSYPEAGEYTVKLTVNDNADPPHEVSDITTATIICPIELNFTGGLGVTITVKNTGDENLTNVTWKVSFDGGFVIPREKTGTISLLAAGTEEKIQVFVFGLGKTTITVQAGCAEKTATGFVFLFFVLGVK